MSEDKKLSIYALTRYYVTRYDLPTQNRAGSAWNKDDGMGAYVKAVNRLLKNTPIGETTLYDAILPDGSGIRSITIAEFERFCFPRWEAYLKKACTEGFNMGALQADIDRWHIEYDRAYWDAVAQSAASAQLKALTEGYNNPPMEDDLLPVVSEEEIQQKGHDLMVEALFYIFYDGFDWEKLRQDMNDSIITPEEVSSADFTGAMMRAKARLKSYLNYVGERKKH